MSVRTSVRGLAASSASVALLATALVSSATAAVEPETELITYTWSHTAHLASFTFGSPDPEATFECSLTAPGEPASWTGCLGAAATQYGSLAAGDYLFRVRAVTASGVDATPASRQFNIGIDEVHPVTSLSTTARTTARDATFTFTSSEPGTFECRFLTGGKGRLSYEPCTSPVVYSGLADAQYEFTVRAIDTHGEYDRDGARHTWLLDATPPETSFTTGRIDGSNASFGFGSPEGTSQCTLTGPSQSHAWKDCASPTKYAGLAPGSYTWQVRAHDRHGNVDPTPGAQSWQVLPRTGKVTGVRTVTRGSVATFRLSSPHAGARFSCKLDRGRWTSCRKTHRVRTGKLKASARGAKHVLRVRATVAGVTDATPAKKVFRVRR